MTAPRDSKDPTLAKRVRGLRPELSWNECRALIRTLRVTVNGETADDDTMRISTDDKVQIHNTPSRAKPVGTETSAVTELKVYYRDEHLIVAEKPSGIESVPFENRSRKSGWHSAAKDSLTFIERCHRWLEREEKRKIPPLKVLQRLDKGTSGIIVFARTSHAEKQLGQLFRTHDIKRAYTAFCIGAPKPGTIVSLLVEDRGDGRRGSSKNPKMGKKSITHRKILESRTAKTGQIVTMVECVLETGRTHQIRIHMCESGHPLCGEEVYRNVKPFSPEIADHSKIPRIGLHAAILGFRHPVTMTEMSWDSPLPADLKDWWDQCRPA